MLLLLVVAVPLLVWRLSNGPIALDFLTPSIRSAAVAKDNAWHVDLDDTVLVLGHGRHMFEIQALNVRFYLGQDPNPALTIPTVAMSFNTRSLLSGLLAPATVRIEEPRFHLVRDENGHMLFGVNDNPDVGPALPAVLLDELTGEYDPAKPGRQLLEFAIIGAELSFEDRMTQRKLDIPWADLTIRRTPGGGAFDVSATFDQDMGAGRAAVKGDFQRESGKWSLAVTSQSMQVSPFSRLDVALAPLSIMDFPISGSVTFDGDMQHGLQHAAFDLVGEPGKIRLLVPAGFEYNVAQASLKGQTQDDLKRLVVDEAKVVLAEGPLLAAKVQLGNLGQGPVSIAVESTYEHLAFDALGRLWPEIVAPNPREWILANIPKGMVKDGTLSLAASWNPAVPDDLAVQKLTGRLKATGLTVNYITPMPMVHDGFGEASFDQHDFRIEIAGGETEGLKITKGLVVLSGLDKADQLADIDLTIAGRLPDVLKVIDHKPLGYASQMGIDPSVVGGDAITNLKLRFPLLKDLRLDSIAVKVHSDVVGGKLPKVFADLDLTEGKLALDLDARGMDVTGPIQLGGIPAHLQWRENFVAKAPFRSRYVLKSTAIEAKQLPVLGLDTAPFTYPWLDGTLGANVVVVSTGRGKADIDVQADLAPARMTLPGLDWKKETKTTGGAKVHILVENNRITAIPSFDVVAGDLKVNGGIVFADGHARHVDFRQLRFGRTQGEGTLDIAPNGVLNVNLSGPSFDAKGILSHDGDDPAKPQAKDNTPIRVNAQFKRVWLSRPGSINDVTATLSRDQGEWRRVSLAAKVGPDAQDFHFEVSPQGAQQRKLQLTSPNAGEVLKQLDWYKDMVGGTLAIDARIADDKPKQPMSGTIHVGDFKVINTPALARLVTVASLTGLGDVLKGEGVSFSTLDAPFTLTDGVISIRDAHTSGSALGLTANGEVDSVRSRLALDGTLVPFYSINSALGGVPVLGWLLNGGEVGSGVVAFNYSMKGSTDDPEVTINPLTAFTPGFLRHLFDIFDGGAAEGMKKNPG